jgi:hypothetical protein
MRLLLPLLCGALLLPACGGGGADGGSGGPQVLGKVTRRTGSEAGLGGVTVTCGNTGEVDVTALDGSFSFDVPSGETITVTVRDGTLAVTGGGWDCEEGDDDATDGVDASEDEFELEPLDEGEVVTVEIELENGEIIECWVDGDGGGRGGEDGEGECPLLPDPTLAPNARGEIEVVRDGDCVDLEVEVSGVDGAQSLSVVLLTPRGEHQVGTMEVGEEGTGHFEGSVCLEDLPTEPPTDLPPLPPGVPEELENLLDELPPIGYPEMDPFAGSLLLLVNADGAVVFVGFLPGPGIEMGDGWSEPGEGWDGGIEPGDLPDFGDLPSLEDLLDLPGLPPDLGATLEELLAPFLPK